MMKRLVITLGTLLTCFAMTVPASATTIDFGTGLAGAGGSVQVLADGSILGTNIPIGSVTITFAPANNGAYLVTGTAPGTGAILPSPGFGSLNFYTGSSSVASYITISGCIASTVLGPGLGIGTNPCNSPLTLLSGTISSFDSSQLSRGLVSAVGIDSKNPQLLAALGLPSNIPFAFFGFSLSTPGGLTAGGAAQAATSTDIVNNAIPEPGSLLLLGTGALGLASRVRRRFAKK